MMVFRRCFMIFHRLNYGYFHVKCYIFYFFDNVKCASISFTISLNVTLFFQFQSRFAKESSIVLGQESAIVWRKSGLYSILNVEICFFISSAISFGEKLIAA